MFKLFSVAIISAFVLAPAASVDAAKPSFAEAAKPGENTIIEIVLAEDGEFDVLQAAVIKAGLVDALNGKRQYTVFAPTDQAFIDTLGASDEADAITIVESLPVEDLTNILLYHVMPGRHTSQSVLARDDYRMLNRDRLNQEELSAAGIEAVDTSAKNGVVHIINSVLIPS